MQNAAGDGCSGRTDDTNDGYRSNYFGPCVHATRFV
jgi:hypothetical protein